MSKGAVYLLQKKLTERALNRLSEIQTTEIEVDSEDRTLPRRAPVYLESLPQSVTMIGQRLSDAGLVYDLSQYQRKSTFLEIRYKDKHHYQKVNILLKDIDLSVFMEV